MILLTMCIGFSIYFTSKYLNKDTLFNKIKDIFGELLLAIIGFLSLIFLLKKDVFNIIDDNKTTNSIITLYILWIGGLFASRIALAFKLAPLLGSLLIGVLLKNIPIFEYFIVENKDITESLCDIGFIIILIRSGIALNIKALRKYFLLCLSIVTISTLFDFFSTAGLCYKILNFPLQTSILFSIVLSCVAPVIIVPIMIEFKKRTNYESTGLITIILASATLINMLCVTAFAIVISINFEGEISFIELQKPISHGIIIGIFSGVASSFITINIFQHVDGNCHFKKGLTIMTYCLLMYFGGKYYKNTIIGSVGIISFTLIINYIFNKNNEEGLDKVDDIFKYGWNNFIEPLLFSTIGTSIKISEMNLNIFLIALLITVISTIVKLIALISTSTLSHLNFKESIYIAFSFTAKATVQAALAPKLAIFLSQKNLPIEASLGYTIDKVVIIVTIISIIISAPLGHSLMTHFSHFILKEKDESGGDLDDTSRTEERQNFI
uniref:Na_H_Exchanger domain-containing protein n=1 Tax=Strongyloides papillosus TaxID=174720 RepID=A0A0N5BRT2_STREA